MEGALVLVTDFSDEISCNLLEFLVEKNATTLGLVRDFENLPPVMKDFPTTIPIVLNVNQNLESVIDHLSLLPPISVVFNFDGEQFENLYHQAYSHFKTITVCKDDFDISKIYNDILDSISDESPLFVNIGAFPLSSAISSSNEMQLSNLSNAIDSYQNLRVVFERLFVRNFPRTSQLQYIKPRKTTEHRNSRTLSRRNPFVTAFRRLLLRFSPCCTAHTLRLLPVCSSAIVRNPDEVRRHFRLVACQEIREAFRTIHESAHKNWKNACVNDLKLTPELEKQFQRMCQDIHRKAEEGRALLLEKAKKDIERTKQWAHVLGPKAMDRLKASRDKEIDLKVQQFCSRKMTEARHKIEEEIEQIKIRTKSRFHREILDEQVMELVRIEDTYQKRMELVMQPCAGEFRIIR